MHYSLDPSVVRPDDGSTLTGGSDYTIARLDPRQLGQFDSLIDPGIRSVCNEHGEFTRFLLQRNLIQPQPGHTPPAAVALVIPCRNHETALRTLLHRIDDALRAAFAEIVVVDDGSTPPIGDLGIPGIRTVRHEQTRGAAAARQTGWHATQAPLILFADADLSSLGPDILALTRFFNDDSVGAVAARVLSGEQPPKVPAAIRAFEQNCGTLDMGPTPSEVLPRTRVPYAPTAALAVRRTALQSIGGFDPALQIGEDVDLVWRLIEAGWRVRYQPSVTVTHVPRSSWPSWLRQRYIYGRSNAALAHRHPQNVVAVEATVGNVLPWLGVLWGGRRGAIFAGSTAILGALPLLHRLQLITTDPLPRAVTLQGLGIGYAGTALAQTIRRSWLPLGIVATAMKPRRAVVLVASFVVPASLRWFMDRPDIGLPAWIGVTAADDASYCAGQWVESIRRRSFRALRPSLTPLDRFFPTDIPTVS